MVKNIQRTPQKQKEKKMMKKISLALVLAMFITACDNPYADDIPEMEANASTENWKTMPEQEEQPSLGEMMEDMAGADICDFEYLEGMLYINSTVVMPLHKNANKVTLGQLQQLAPAIRILGPGDVATFEYDPQRLTINLDENGVIDSANCG
jgi:hypothetical protein